MVIQHNLSAMNSHRQLGINNGNTSKNLEKLSSGYKVNRAGDDAAGLAISEKMRGQIRGLAMANQNSQNGISLIQTAEGGLNETHAILQRMRELAVQSANGTYMDDVDRENIAKEVTALKSEIDRIASSTHYNGIKLLDGSMGGQSIKAYINANETAQIDTDLVSLLTTGGNSLTTFELVDADAVELYKGQEATILVRQNVENSVTVASLSLQIGDRTFSATSNSTTTNVDFGYLDDTNSFVTVGRLTLDSGGDFFANSANVTTSGVIKTTISADGSAQALSADQGTIIATDKSELVFQIGANGTADQRVGLHVDNMSTGFLGDIAGQEFIHDISVASREKANDAIRVIDLAINQVSGTRADLGALQNRLEHTINNLGTTTENLQAAESTIRDVDMAKEMMEFTKNNILVQASQSMLAQANQLPQGVLSLLR